MLQKSRQVVVMNGQMYGPNESHKGTHQVYILTGCSKVYIYDPMMVNGESLYIEYCASQIPSHKRQQYLQYMGISLENVANHKLFPKGVYRSRNNSNERITLINSECLSSLMCRFVDYQLH